MLNLKDELNEAQYRAATHTNGPLLVIAGAGTGKTRTITYRIAHLLEQGVLAKEILLLTFTKKAAQEMLFRAESITKTPLIGLQGGTFHAFSYMTLKRYAHFLNLEKGFTLLDGSDSEQIIKQAKENLKLGLNDRSFPKKATLLGLISKSRNKELSIENTIEHDAIHLSTYIDDIVSIDKEYHRYKHEHRLLDYDDLLFTLEKLLLQEESVREELQTRFRHIMVDEYQDTNRVQARLVKLLANKELNVMAVGDDAQSIYAFRGADVKNILAFPEIFPNASIITLEENYRSSQEILEISNTVLAGASHKFEKELFSQKKGDIPKRYSPMSDHSQSRIVVKHIAALEKEYPLKEIAVLFRAGYQSYSIEMELNKEGLPFRKYGGQRFNEAAHIKDIISYIRVLIHSGDVPAWQRLLSPIKGVGAKTCNKIVMAILQKNDKELDKAKAKYPELVRILDFLSVLENATIPFSELFQMIFDFYLPFMPVLYPDDYPKRQNGIEELLQIALSYTDKDEFLADICLDSNHSEKEVGDNALVLSTIHSAKGLEWSAVLLIDLVEERFPSKRALYNPEEMEEERRLMYVACTRAKEHLYMYTPASLYNRQYKMAEQVAASPFITELSDTIYTHVRESYTGEFIVAKKKNITTDSNPLRATLKPHNFSDDSQDVFNNSSHESSSYSSHGSFQSSSQDSFDEEYSSPKNSNIDPNKLGFCEHKIFGKGKVIGFTEPDKYKVNFPGFGVKTIIGTYLTFL